MRELFILNMTFFQLLCINYIYKISYYSNYLKFYFITYSYIYYIISSIFLNILRKIMYIKEDIL